MCSFRSIAACLMRRAACVSMGGLSVSRPSLMNTTRWSVTWHSEQTNVWCSTPRTATVSSGTTLVRINSAPHAVQRTSHSGTHTHRAPTRYWDYRHWPPLCCANTLLLGITPPPAYRGRIRRSHRASSGIGRGVASKHSAPQIGDVCHNIHQQRPLLSQSLRR